jgi:glycosyltransferase involved in cell wall biosynthesis
MSKASKATNRQNSSAFDKNTQYISVVVPFHNAAKHIERCITALISQTYPSSAYEIIMVDNNSTDNSVELVTKYPQVKLLSETKKGPYAARNLGAAESRGEIIAFTDSDCEPSPEWLNKISDAINKPGIGLIQGGRLYTTDSPSLLLLESYESERADYTFSGRADGLYYGYTNNMAVRRDLFERCGPFVEVMRGADSIFVNRAVQDYSYRIIRYAPDATIQHSEITGLREYFRKKFIYGRSFQQNYALRKETHKNMTIAQRSEIVKRTIHRNKYSLLQTLPLIVYILIGTICFMSGRASAIFEKLYKKPLELIMKRYTI